MKKIIFVILSVIFQEVVCVEFNITMMSNCRDVPLDYQNDAEVEIMNIIYQKNGNGFFDTISGEFLVHIHREHKETELAMWFFKCPKGTTEICDEMKQEFIDPLSCKRFLNDDTGPWHMFAPAMDKRNVCAELTGTYSITNATMKAKYLEKYMTIVEGHYRIKAMHHVINEDFSVKNLRSCVEVDFDIYT